MQHRTYTTACKGVSQFFSFVNSLAILAIHYKCGTYTEGGATSNLVMSETSYTTNLARRTEDVQSQDETETFNPQDQDGTSRQSRSSQNQDYFTSLHKTKTGHLESPDHLKTKTTLLHCTRPRRDISRVQIISKPRLLYFTAQDQDGTSRESRSSQNQDCFTSLQSNTSTKCTRTLHIPTLLTYIYLQDIGSYRQYQQ